LERALDMGITTILDNAYLEELTRLKQFGCFEKPTPLIFQETTP